MSITNINKNMTTDFAEAFMIFAKWSKVNVIEFKGSESPTGAMSFFIFERPWQVGLYFIFGLGND